MAITTRYATNMAMQYNEVDLSDFLINPSVGSRRFLTEAEQTRLLRATEVSALYFITDTSGQFYSARYRWYDSGGTMLNEHILSLSPAGVHNSIPVDWSSFFVPSGAVKMTVSIIGAVNGFANGDFSQGTGNLFTSWTLTQPSRTNLVLRSQEFDNAYWVKANVSVTANSVVAPDGTTTADTITEAAVNSSFHIDSGNTTVINGSTYTMSVSAKSNGRRYVLLYEGFSDIGVFFDLQDGIALGSLGAGTLVSSHIYLEENGFYRIIVTYVQSGVTASQQMYLSNDGTGVAYNGNGTSGIYAWGAQLELGAYATPYMPTTNTAVTTTVGEFLQDETGGPDGSRCIRMWVDTSTITLLSQAVNLVSGQNYTIRFRAKSDDINNSHNINIVVGLTDIGDTGIDSEWRWFSKTFTATATASTSIYFAYLNDTGYGFASLDDVTILPTSVSLLSEERTYLLDDSCVVYEYQLNWLNKLGGRDTWVMTGFPIETVEVRRNNEIEYSARTNYTSPNRIYGYRENKSRKSITLSHQCKDRATAEWIKSELIDSIDMILLINGVYYPCDVVPNSIVVRNTFSQDYTVRVTLRYAYDINVQTR